MRRVADNENSLQDIERIIGDGEGHSHKTILSTMGD
jgi:hypothetical protein